MGKEDVISLFQFHVLLPVSCLGRKRVAESKIVSDSGYPAPDYSRITPRITHVLPTEDLGFWIPHSGFRTAGTGFQNLCPGTLDSGLQSLM